MCDWPKLSSSESGRARTGVYTQCVTSVSYNVCMRTYALSLRIPPELDAELKLAAALEQRSVGWLVRHALREYLDANYPRDRAAAPAISERPAARPTPTTERRRF